MRLIVCYFTDTNELKILTIHKAQKGVLVTPFDEGFWITSKPLGINIEVIGKID